MPTQSQLRNKAVRARISQLIDEGELPAEHGRPLSRR
jgi:hypothetical protein